MRKLLIVVCALALLAGFVLVVSAAPKHVWKPTKAQLEAAKKIGKPVIITNSIGMKFVLIPAGSFMMGSRLSVAEVLRRYIPAKDHKLARNWIKNEHPRHRVVISRPFYMQTTEVTQAQYRKIMGKSPSYFQNCDRCPVEWVSWDDAREFIKRLNAREGTNEYRLATEAEWEYACRAGTTTPFYFGRTISPKQANFAGYLVYGSGPGEVYRKKTTPVGSFPPNRWGLYDMHGNVEEWCSDWYGKDYYSTSLTRDPRGPSSGRARVLRGGSWICTWGLRSASRGRSDPWLRSAQVGFRVVRLPFCLASAAPKHTLAPAAPKHTLAPAVPKHTWKPSKAQLEAAKKIGKPAVFTNSIGMKFVLIPAGSFLRGSPATELGRNPEESPQGRVVISRPFYMQTTEVTHAQYRKIMGKNPSHFKGCERCPVEMVSWYDAREFIKRLNAREGTNKYRLPFEAEWEYSCRAGTTTPFYFGDTISTDQANYDGREVYGRGRKGVYRQQTMPVGSFPPNRWGLYDMHGNVAEWCSDWYEPLYYEDSEYPSTDPKGPLKNLDLVLTRGGSWKDFPRWLRSAARSSLGEWARDHDTGFRVVRMP